MRSRTAGCGRICFHRRRTCFHQAAFFLCFVESLCVKVPVVKNCLQPTDLENHLGSFLRIYDYSSTPLQFHPLSLPQLTCPQICSQERSSQPQGKISSRLTPNAALSPWDCPHWVPGGGIGRLEPGRSQGSLSCLQKAWAAALCGKNLLGKNR